MRRMSRCAQRSGSDPVLSCGPGRPTTARCARSAYLDGAGWRRTRRIPSASPTGPPVSCAPASTQWGNERQRGAPTRRPSLPRLGGPTRRGAGVATRPPLVPARLWLHGCGAVALRVAMRGALPEVVGEDGRLDAANVGGDTDRNLDRVVRDGEVHEPVLLGGAAGARGGGPRGRARPPRARRRAPPGGGREGGGPGPAHPGRHPHRGV